MVRTRDMYHEESEETMLQSLINEGHDYQDAQDIIDWNKEEAFNEQQIDQIINEPKDLPF